jgi:Uma2 family endonuclease
MTIADPIVRRWTREEYYRMGEMGLFQDQRVELIEGEIIQMAPQLDIHAACIGLVTQEANRVFLSGYWVRTQLPLCLGAHSEPEPDVSVVRGSPRDFVGTGHPREAALIIEASSTTLLFDQTTKMRLYAQFGFKDYWIINLVDRVVEVRREPNQSTVAYDRVEIYPVGDMITPLAAPHAKIAVNDLLP